MYAFWDAEREELVWEKEWFEGEDVLLPKAVLVMAQIVFYDKDSKKIKEKRIKKEILIPQGDWVSEEYN